jgi:outer membrane receptor protein involved in Fe transport
MIGLAATPDCRAANSAETIAGGSSDVEMGEIVVTAQKRVESVEKVPISISVLSGKDLDRSTSGAIADILNTVPAVATLSSFQGGGTQVTIRGVAAGQALLNGAGTVGYYIDSVPFGLVKEAIGPDESAYDLQRVEVLRGPQGTLYGVSALNGVVRVLTNDADLGKFEFKARSSGSYTENGGGNLRDDVAVNIPIIDDVLAVRAVVGYEHDSGWINTPNRNNFNTANLLNMRLKVNAQISDALSIAVSQWSTRNRYGGPSVGESATYNPTPYAEPIENNYDATGLKINYQANIFAIQSSTSYLNYRSNSFMDYSEFFAGTPASLGTNLGSRVVSEELLATSTGGGPWRWSVGDTVRKATEVLVQGIPQFVFGLNYQDESKSNAVYGEVTRLLFDDALELTAGVRYFQDHVTQNDQTGYGTPFLPADSTSKATTPRAVISYHPDNDWTLYASYSQGFRSGYPQNAAASALPAVQPDRLTNYELGSKGRFLDGLIDIDASVYYMNWVHVQQSITVTQNGTFFGATVNGDSASGSGVDLAINAHPFSGFTLNGSVSWNGLKLDKATYSFGQLLFAQGARLNFSPEWTASAGAHYTFPLVGNMTGEIGASANYVSEQYNRVLLGTDVLVGLGNPQLIPRATLAVNTDNHWRFSLYGDNLSNYQRSPIPGYGNLPEYYGQVRPRTIGLQAELKY